MSGSLNTTAGSHMRSEIAEQPDRWLDLIARQREQIAAAAQLIVLTSPDLLIFAARGSSDHAAMFGQYLAHNMLGIPALLATPSTVTAFGTQLRFPNSVMLAVSQSGESPDLLETVQATQHAGVPVIGLTNDKSSSLAKLSDVHVALSAGPELSVAATKTYTAELLALYATIMLSSGITWLTICQRIEAAAEAAKTLMDESIPLVASLATSILGHDRVLIVGRGYSMSTAKEGALKLMETNRIAASGWSAADAKHGPLGQIVAGTPVIFLTSSPGGRESVESLVGDVEGLDGSPLFIGPDEYSALNYPGLDTALIPLLEIIPLQLLALELAALHGLDPDRPAGLLKVTQTR
ncbi:SIS domain-containing protein [Cryobacterium mannosilyticum]|uniref:SIS domain-containing protein n=1 Tax=Cryobacterium mannosilyticum TaxID=1259190 RepID=A0A4R8WD79_9MICO|nr:SIS domain-containing protein [Cryobacterium mannosilyticum]TFC05227.1 SIS domain-containing protein [Cryobacterium mannosilyticum]